MLLIHPPVAKPSEPPTGTAQLSATLENHGITCTVLDLNLEGMIHLLHHSPQKDDQWSRRSRKNLITNLEKIRSPELYSSPARYRKTVQELNRLLENYGEKHQLATLANYQDPSLSPVRSEDLLRVAEHPELCLFHDFFLERLSQTFNEKTINTVGISINYLSQAISAFCLIGVIKRFAPKTRIIVGGGLITSWMRGGNWKNPFKGLIDHCIDGCGERPLLDIFGVDYTSSSLPAHEKLPLKDYIAPGFILPYSGSSGCFWNKCSFCPEQAEGNPFKRKEEINILRDLKIMEKRFSPQLIHFLDNAMPPALLKFLARNPLKTPWYGFTRITQNLLDLDFCLALKRSGCAMLKLGVESGNQKVLDNLSKGIQLHEVSKVLKNLNASGIATYIYLLFGTPVETHEEARDTLTFTLKHHREIDFLNLAIFNLPLAAEHAESLQRSKFYGGDLSLYTDFSHPKGWNRKEVRLFLDKEFKRQPEIARILQNDPPHFTSNHAAFFV